jgi:hypothetical protein
MKSAMLGPATSASVEVTHVSKHGFWILLEDRELFLPFQDFPWFEQAPIHAVMNVEQPHPGHLYWPELDVDLEVEAIEQPGEYPLVWQGK